MPDIVELVLGVLDGRRAQLWAVVVQPYLSLSASPSRKRDRYTTGSSASVSGSHTPHPARYSYSQRSSVTTWLGVWGALAGTFAVFAIPVILAAGLADIVQRLNKYTRSRAFAKFAAEGAVGLLVGYLRGTSRVPW